MPALPTTDTVKIIDDNGIITGHIERNHGVGVQTPQIFRWPAIWEAHQQAREQQATYTDDTQVFTDYGMMVGSAGRRENRKILPRGYPDAEEQIEAYQQNLREAERAGEATRLFQRVRRRIPAERSL